jgi:hypothetical protein
MNTWAAATLTLLAPVPDPDGAVTNIKFTPKMNVGIKQRIHSTEA